MIRAAAAVGLIDARRRESLTVTANDEEGIRAGLRDVGHELHDMGSGGGVVDCSGSGDISDRQDERGMREKEPETKQE